MDTSRGIAIIVLIIAVCFVVYKLYVYHRDLDNFHIKIMRDREALDDELQKILADMKKKNEGRNEEK